MALLQLPEHCSVLQFSSSRLPNPLKPPRNPRRIQLSPPNEVKIPGSSGITTPTAPKAAILTQKAAAPWRGKFLLLLLPVAAASWPLPSLAAEVDGKVSLESIVVAIDDFNNRNPFFVAGAVFVSLVVIPLVQEYFKKYKAVGAINAFRKLRDVPEAQLLDIRRGKSVRFMAPPNLRLVGKSTVQVEFDEVDEEGFLREVLARFPDPANTVICVLDKGKKEQKSVHIDVSTDGTDDQQEGNGELLPSPSSSTVNTSNGTEDGCEKPNRSTSAAKNATRRPLSPYPNYHDLKPPSSPTPSKPEG